MCAANHHPWSLPTGLPCLGTGDDHTPRYEASDVPDRHDVHEARAEATRG